MIFARTKRPGSSSSVVAGHKSSVGVVPSRNGSGAARRCGPRARMYVATMLGSPLFQILFFTYLGRYTGSEGDAFFIVGNAIQIAAMSSVYGMTMGVANERQFGTLQPLLATPANRLAVFVGRALPFVANGLVVSLFGFVVSWLLLDRTPS